MSSLSDIQATLIANNAEEAKQTSLLEKIDRYMSDSRMDAIEAKRESRGGGVLTGTGNLVKGVGEGAGGMLGGLGGLLGGFGGAAAGLGTGVGMAAGGLGVFLAGGGYLLEKLEEFDGAAIRQNLLELVHIKDDFDGMGNFFLEGGLFGVTMTMIGTGLAAFAIGAGSADLVTKFETPGWPDKIKDNVATLLSMSELPGFNAWTGTNFGLTMLGIGAGLAAFSIGKFAGTVVEGVGGAIDKFTGTPFAQNIYDQVSTLLSIMDLPNVTAGNVVGFGATMLGISAGLTAFALGKGVNTVVEGASEALGIFTSESFAQGIYDEVSTLLSIMDLPGVGGDAAGFTAVMLGLSAGLTAFALGKGVNTVVEGADQALAYFTGDGTFADRIYDQVSTLLSIMEMPGIGGDTVGFIATMTGLSAGLLAFAGGEFVGTLANAGTAILGFFGVDKPFDQIMDIARNADDLSQGADALEKITNALNAFGQIDIGRNRIDFGQLAEDLGAAIPLLDRLANGGVYDTWAIGDQIDFGNGLLDPNLRLDEMAAAISKVNYVLGQTTVNPVASTVSTLPSNQAMGIAPNGAQVAVIAPDQIEALISAISRSSQPAGGGGSTTVFAPQTSVADPFASVNRPR